MSVEARSEFDMAQGRAPSRPPSAATRWLVRTFLGTLFARLKVGRLTVVTPDGHRLSSTAPGPAPDAVLVLHRWRTLRRLAVGGDVAFAEAYMDGDWSSPDVAALVELAARNDEILLRTVSGIRPAQLMNRLRHMLRPNSRTGSRRNIVAHYDLGNRFYARWLDEDMSYSSGIFRRPDASLEEAQAEKQDRIIAALDLRGGESVLEIGCGWGGLAERIAERGCRVVGLTLSPAQLAHARERIGRAGLADRVELRLEDYRDVAGRFDRIVSVEMIEAVGRAYWPSYFDVLRERLVPGGRAVVQAITLDERRFPFYAAAPDFIQRYVFPGGMLPTKTILRERAAAANLSIETEAEFGPCYARTLRLWRERFIAAWPDLQADFDEPFRRLWEYYLAYCEAGFRAGTTDVGIYRLGRA